MTPKIPRRRARPRARRTGRARAIAQALALLLLAAPSAADIIHFKDGRTLEGRILERSRTELTVETDFGRIKVAMSKVARIEEKLTPREELENRRAAIAADDAAALFELALWARDQELGKEFLALLREVIAAAPDHQLANELLGRVKIDGRWFEPEELDAYVRSMEAEKRAQGLVFHQGRWQPEEDVMRARGFVRHAGAWLPRRQAETAIAIESLAVLGGLEVQAVAGPHLTIYSALPEEAVRALLDPLEKQVDWFVALVEPDEQEAARLFGHDLAIVLVPDRTAVEALVTSGALRDLGLGESLQETYRFATNFAVHWPRPLIVLAASGDHVKVTGDEDEGRLGILSHQLASVLAERFKGETEAPPWFVHGLGALVEGRANRHGTLSITSPPRGEDGEVLDPFVPGWEEYSAWVVALCDESRHVQIPPLRTILRQRIDNFDSREVGVCWSLLRYLIDHRRTELLAYLRVYGTAPGAAEKDHALRHEDAWEQSFADPLADVEADWRLWALAQPPIVR